MKYALPVIILTLIGCITDPQPQKPYEVPASCLQYDSTTWTDTVEVEHLSCHIDPKAERR